MADTETKATDGLHGSISVDSESTESMTELLVRLRVHTRTHTLSCTRTYSDASTGLGGSVRALARACLRGCRCTDAPPPPPPVHMRWSMTVRSHSWDACPQLCTGPAPARTTSPPSSLLCIAWQRVQGV